MGCPHKIKIRAGPNFPPAQRRPGPAPPRERPRALKIIVILIVILPLAATPWFRCRCLPERCHPRHPTTRPAPDSWGGQSRAATPFACGAGTLWRGIARGSRMLSRLAQPLRPWPVPESEKYQKPPKYHFLRFETAPHNYPTHRRQPTGGRARHSVRAAIDIPADKLSQPPPSQC